MERQIQKANNLLERGHQKYMVENFDVAVIDLGEACQLFEQIFGRTSEMVCLLLCFETTVFFLNQLITFQICTFFT